MRANDDDDADNINPRIKAKAGNGWERLSNSSDLLSAVFAYLHTPDLAAV